MKTSATVVRLLYGAGDPGEIGWREGEQGTDLAAAPQPDSHRLTRP